MEKNLLVIDDDPDQRSLDLLKRNATNAVNQGSPIHYEVNLGVVNPIDYINGSGLEPYALNSLFDYLDTNYLNKKLDLFLCDFNIHARNKDLAFHILAHVRSRNKSCSIVLYSGSPIKELTRINNQVLATQILEHINTENRNLDINLLKRKIDRITNEELPSEELLRITINANLTKVVSRTDFIRTAVELIRKPSPLLTLENYLCSNNQDFIFRDTGMSLDNQPIRVLCEHIRTQTQEGVKFTSELMELMVLHFMHAHELS